MPLSCNMGYASIKMAKKDQNFLYIKKQIRGTIFLVKNPRWFTQVAVKPKRWMLPLLIKYFIPEILLVKRGNNSSDQWFKNQ